MPEKPRRVEKLDVVSQAHPLLALGHAWLVASGRHAAAKEHVDERALANIGNPHNHHAQRHARRALVEKALALRCCQLVNRIDDRLLELFAAACGIHRHREIVAGGVFREPVLCAVRIGQIRLVEDDQTRTLFADDLAQKRIAAAFRNARIDQLNDHIDELQLLLDHATRLCHVPREPLDRCHQLNPPM